MDDPRFLVYERVSRRTDCTVSIIEPDDRRFKAKLAVNVLSPIGFGLVKASIIVLYKGIFRNVRPFRWAANVMLGLLGGWSLSFFFANLFICYPVTALIEPFYDNKCVDRAAVFLSTLVTDLIFDVLILAMPVPLVLRLHLPLRDRLGVLGMFLLGAMQVSTYCCLQREHPVANKSLRVVAVSIARLIQLLEVNSQYLNFYNDVTCTYPWPTGRYCHVPSLRHLYN